MYDKKKRIIHWRSVIWGVKKEKCFLLLNIVSWYYNDTICNGEARLSQHAHGRINLFPSMSVDMAMFFHQTCHSPTGPHNLFIINHAPFSKCAFPSHFPLWGTYNSTFLVSLRWNLKNKCLSGKAQSWPVSVQMLPLLSGCSHLFLLNWALMFPLYDSTGYRFTL